MIRLLDSIYAILAEIALAAFCIAGVFVVVNLFLNWDTINGGIGLAILGIAAGLLGQRMYGRGK